VLARAADSGDAEAVSRALGDLAAAAGSRQLAGGQADDLVYDSAGGSSAGIVSVHARKTAALIAASIVGGARLAGASAARLVEFEAFGRDLGIAFQIADDLLDEEEEDHCSLARALGPQGAEARATELLASALGRVEDLGGPAEPLRGLARFAVQRTV